ncbi:MAG: T9SS type A sorting domain-containing protein, partial [Bacteroidetes bacterium]|nr:T9SS type A sorting domain-containing protein [Bacteroidota bacterium]
SLQVQFNASVEGQGYYTVYDLMGRMVLSGNMPVALGNQVNTLSTEGLENGLYLIEVRVNDQTLSKTFEVSR